MSKELPVKRYESAGGVVRSSDGEQMLVLLRGERLGPEGRPEVRLPKGHIEPGETPRQAAVREVREEAGLSNLEVLRDLGHQRVEFDWQGTHYVRDERCYLMATTSATAAQPPEAQFERRWLPWTQALARLTFEAEREWVRRARSAGSDARD